MERYHPLPPMFLLMHKVCSRTVNPCELGSLPRGGAKRKIMIPILLNHDRQDIVGKIEFLDNSLLVEFREPILDKVFFDAFDCGIKILDCEVIDEEIYIKKGMILEFSIL